MTSALIGYTGFVGGNLLAVRTFDELYNSRNIGQIHGRSFDTVVLSAAKAEKWKINQDPESDAAHIEDIEQTLCSISAKRVILISTIDVYREPVLVTEDTEIDEAGLHPYGLHRRRLERFVAKRFAQTHVLRLPGLFGPGLKKNVIYDFLHDNNVDRIHTDGVFQYYDLRWLADDVDRIVANELPLVNLATEPISTREVARWAFGMDFDNRPDGVRAGRYDMRSRYSSLWHRDDGYLYGRSEVLGALVQFVASERTP